MLFLVGAEWLLVGVAPAQNTPPSPAPAKVAANPEHERLKKDAEDAYHNGDFPKAIELASRVVTSNPKDHVALYLRASARVELGNLRRDLKDVRGGVEDAREAMRHGGTDQLNYYLPYFYGMTTLAQLENRKEHAEVVVNFAGQVLARPALKPDDRANILYHRANSQVFLRHFALAQQKMDEATRAAGAAVTDFEAAIKLVPGHVGARLGLADLFEQSREPDKAEAAYAAAVEAVPNNPLVFNNRGMFFQRQSKSEQAVADFTRAIELDNTFSVAYTNRGFAAMAAGHLPAAENDFSAALRIDSSQPLVFSLRGTARLSQGNTKGAIEDYNQVLQADPKSPVAHGDLGFAKFFAEDYVAAAAEFNQALSIDEKAVRHLLPWRFWSQVRAGQATSVDGVVAEILRKPADNRDWVDDLLVFLAGKSTEQDVVNAADDTDANLKKAQLCEAFFFCGEKRTVAKDPGGAAQYYKQTLDTKQNHLAAYRGAQFALKQFPTSK